MKLSLAVQFTSTAFTATAASSSSVYVTEELAKKYYNRNVNAAATSRTVPSRNLVSINDAASSKSSKSSSSTCPPEPTTDVQCGNVYNSTAGDNAVVILDQNLICEGNITEADGIRHAALTLVGKDAVLDCQDYTISQVTYNGKGSAAALDCSIDLINPTEVLRMKKECGFFYIFGVRLIDGASIRNCNIQKFWAGSVITNGGKIENSEFSLNTRGVEIVNRGANTVARIANSEFYNNRFGLYTFQMNEDDAKVSIEDVTANNNAYLGMFFAGTGITVKNVNIKNTDGPGIMTGQYFVNKITLDGDVSITNSKSGFFADGLDQSTVHVTGDINLNRNEVGLSITPYSNLTIAVGGSYSGKSAKSGSSGYLTACNNNVDIVNTGGTAFQGSDYTCDTSFNNSTGADLPKCKPCHPGCPSASMTSTRILSDFVAKNQAEMDNMETLNPMLN